MVPGEWTPTWWGALQRPTSEARVASKGFGHSLEWASKYLGKGGFYKDRSFEICL